MALSKHADSEHQVKDTVKYAFKEFQRCHQDNWVVHSTAFTAEQLEVFDDISAAPHHYA